VSEALSGLGSALRVPEFRALLVSYAVNRAGDVLGALALAVVVFSVTGSALTTAVLFLATQFLPGLTGPWLVSRIDRIAPGRLLPLLYSAECVLFIALALLVARAGVVVIIAVAFADAVLAFIARTITRSATASTLAPHDLIPEGKAAFNVALAAAMIAGPIAAGLVVGLASATAALVIDAGSFLLAGLMVLSASGLRGRVAVDSGTGTGERGRFREGLAYILGRPALRTLILGEGSAFVFFYLVVPVTVVFASRSLHAGSGGYAAILAAWGVGIAIGSAVQVRIARHVGSTMIMLSTAAVAAGYLGTAAAPNVIAACAASVIGGIGNGTQWASVETELHRIVDEAFRARAAAVLEALAAIAPGIGIAVGGALTAAFSARAAYLVAGLGLCALVLGALRSGAFVIGAELASGADPSI
jgi:Major Facilitator Superfamily